MKKILLLSVILNSGLKAEIIFTNLINGEIITSGSGYSYVRQRKGVTNYLTIPNGKQLVVHGINGSPENNYLFPRAFVRANHGADGRVDLAGLGNGVSGWTGPILGPLQIEYGIDQTENWNGSDTNSFINSSVDFLMEVKDSQFLTNSTTTITIPSTAVVVPSNATGDVDVLLEQSTDMITWTQCLPGTYNASTVKRFFRVRAVEK